MGTCWSKVPQCFGVTSTADEPQVVHEANRNLADNNVGSTIHDNGSIPVHHGVGSAVHDDSSSPVGDSFGSALQDNGSSPVSHSVGSAIQDKGSEPDITQLQPSSSSQASTSNKSPKVVSTVKIEDLEKVLGYVQGVISRHKKTPDAKVFIPERGVDQGDHLLNLFSEAPAQTLKKCVDVATEVAAEATTILPDLLDGVASLHWAMSGLSMLAFVSKRLDQMQGNKEDSLETIEILGDLSCHVVGLLRENLPTAHEKLSKAIFLICEGVIWCDKQQQSSRFKRFTFANIASDYIKGLRSRVDQLYKDLTLAVDIQNLTGTRNMSRQMTVPLGPHKFSYPKNAVGLEGKVSEVLHLLGVTNETLEPGVQAILLYGIGGIGKTTLGRAVCEKIPITGRFVAQVEVGERPEPEKIRDIQMQILERFSGTKQNIGNCEEGQEKLQHYLRQCKAPVLLFIDNVFEQDDLSRLLPAGLILPDRSRLVITSRDSTVSDVLDDDKISWQKHAVRPLEEPDSKILLDHSMGDCPLGKEEQVKTILQICGGLPLALELVGKHLKGERKKKLEMWNSTVEGLKEFRNFRGKGKDALNPVLKWSYKQLDDGAQQAFLDISHLLRNAPWDIVECLGSGSELECLQDLSLVMKVDGDEDPWNGDNITWNSKVQVHDLLAALGRHISDHEFPRTRFSFNNAETLENFLKNDQQDYHTVEGLAVDFETSSPTLPADMLDAAHDSLRILVLHGGVHMRGMCSRSPSELQICSTTVMSFGNYGWGTESEIIFPYTNISYCDKLSVLNIQGGIGFDFRDVQLPSTLKFIHLEDVDQLFTFHADAFNKCTSLRYLTIIKCKNFKKFPPSFGTLEQLCTFHLVANEQLESLPKIEKMIKLQKLKISWCPQLIGSLENIVQLKELEIVYITNCYHLKNLPNINNFVALRKLTIYNCPYLTLYPNTIITFNK